MNRTENHFPDLDRFEAELRRLKKKYPSTVHTPDGFFDAVRHGRCSTASVVIDSDGRLFYPCHMLEQTGPDLSRVRLMDYLRGDEAHKARRRMRQCTRRCGWYQYFSINDFTSVTSALRAFLPTLSKIRKQTMKPDKH
jgi:hypothetical protein